jgi:hypothetical protein
MLFILSAQQHWSAGCADRVHLLFGINPPVLVKLVSAQRAQAPARTHKHSGERAGAHTHARMHTKHTQVKQEAADMGNQKDIEYPPWLEGTWQVCVGMAATCLSVCMWLPGASSHVSSMSSTNVRVCVRVCVCVFVCV